MEKGLFNFFPPSSHTGTCIDGQIRLIVGPDALSFYQSGNPSALYLDSDLDQLSRGRVEVCLGGQFGTVCSQTWSNKDASVACRSLGYSPYGNAIKYCILRCRQPVACNSMNTSSNLLIKLHTACCLVYGRLYWVRVLVEESMFEHLATLLTSFILNSNCTNRSN